MASRIRECANKAGSGDELARLTGLPRRTLENYLSGKSEPKATTLAAIAEATGVSVDWLITGEDRRPSVSTQALGALDPELFGWLFDFVVRAYKGEGLNLPIQTLGEISARAYGDLMALGLLSFNENKAAAKAIAAQLARHAVAADRNTQSGKRSA